MGEAGMRKQESRYRTSRLLIGGCLAVLALLCGGAGAGAETLADDAAKLRRIEELYEGYRKEFPGVEELTAAQVLKLAGRMPIVLVDVREEKEQRISILPGAVSEQAFMAQPELRRGKLVVGYCTISYRSGQLAHKLKSQGIQMVNLRGGILAWLHAGGQVAAGGQPVRKVHVYGEKWNLAPAGVEAVW
jgi:sodium/bile acid cotransporter 7